MIDPILAKIRKRSRQQWIAFLNERVTNVRIWIQENGEKAALLALVLGVLLVAAFKLIFTLFVISILIFGAIWVLAEEEATANSSNVTDGTNGVDSSGNGATH